MFERAVDELQGYYDLKVIDTQFQKNVGDAGLLSTRKVLHFFVLLFGKIAPIAFGQKFDILYYCLAGPSTLGLIKDMVFLGVLRWRAQKTVYHFHGAGGIAHIMQRNALLRAWARLVLFKPDLTLRPASSANNSVLCKAMRDVVVDNGIEDPTATSPN